MFGRKKKQVLKVEGGDKVSVVSFVTNNFIHFQRSNAGP